jgi:hypothetical protein
MLKLHNNLQLWPDQREQIRCVGMCFLADPATESSPTIMRSPLNGGVGLAGKTGRKTANACDRNASEMSADSSANLILVVRSTFTEIPKFWFSR